MGWDKPERIAAAVGCSWLLIRDLLSVETKIPPALIPFFGKNGAPRGMIQYTTRLALFPVSS
jgi:hypothetical protein